MTMSPNEPLLDATSAPLAPDVSEATESNPALLSRGGLVARRFFRQKLGLLGLAALLLLILAAFIGPLLDHYKYQAIDENAFLTGPSSAHIFGTDAIGHDVFAATMHGAQKSIEIGLLVAVFATAVAAIVGAAAGYFGGWTDRILMWFVDLMLVVPSFLIIAILSNKFADNWILFVLLLGAFIWQITARIVRGQTLSMKEREFVAAARYMGVSGWRIIMRHILPNLSSLLIIDATVNVSAAILLEAGLSFFGFGVKPPDVSLGTLLDQAQTAAITSPWLFYFPAGFLILLCLSVNLIGDALRDALDPSAGKAQ